MHHPRLVDKPFHVKQQISLLNAVQVEVQHGTILLIELRIPRMRGCSKAIYTQDNASYELLRGT